MKKVFLISFLFVFIFVTSALGSEHYYNGMENNSLVNWASTGNCFINATDPINETYSMTVGINGGDLPCFTKNVTASVNSEPTNFSFPFRLQELGGWVSFGPSPSNFTTGSATGTTRITHWSSPDCLGGRGVCFEGKNGRVNGSFVPLKNVVYNITLQLISLGPSETNIELYVDGVFRSNASMVQSINTYNFFGGHTNTAGIVWDFDDIRITNASVPLSPDSLNVSAQSPANNTQFNTQNLNINATVSSSFNFNATLYINGTINQTKLNLASGQNILVPFNLTFTDPVQRAFTYTISFQDSTGFEKNTSTNLFFIDNVDPVITSNFINRQSVYSGILAGQFNLSDAFNLYGYEVYIDGVLNSSRAGLNVTFYPLNLTINTSVLSVGHHTLNLSVSDGHTAKSIPEYRVEKSRFNNKLIYRFSDNRPDFIEIDPQDGGILDTFETQKLKDRYTFTHKRFFGRNTETYIVRSSHKIDIIEDGRYKGWMVIFDLKKWIDFESNGAYESVNLRQIDDYTVEVTVNGIKSGEITYSSIGSLNTISRVYDFYVGNVTTTLTTPVLETETTTFQAIFSKNESFIQDINANLTWNGTNRGPGTKVNGTTQINFTHTFNIQPVDANVFIPVNWSYVISGVNGTESNVTPTQLQNVLDISLFNCSETNPNATIFLQPKDEETDIDLIADVDITAQFFLDQSNKTGVNKSFEFRNSLNYTICFEPQNSTLVVDAFISYEKSGYSQRNYFLVQNRLGNNQTNRILLYLINESIDSDVTISLTDEDDNVLADHYIKVLRYFPGNNTYKTVEIARTNENGQTVARLILLDVFYRFVVDSGNTTIYGTNSQKVLTSPFFIRTFEQNNFLNKLDRIEQLQYSLTYNNNTGVFSFTFNDLENIVREGTLRVVRKGIVDTVICSNTVQSSAGTITCTINASIKDEYLAQAYIDTNTKNSPAPIDEIYLSLSDEFNRLGATGLIIQMLLLSVMVGAGIWRPSASIVMGIVAIIAGVFMELYALSYIAGLYIILLLIVFIGLSRD